MRKAVWILTGLPGFVFWLLGGLAILLGGRFHSIDRDLMVLVVVLPRWFSAFYGYSMGFGKLVLMNERHLETDRVLKHEKIHTIQFQDDAIVGALIMLCCLPFHWDVGLIIWFSAFMWPLTGFVSSWLRGRRAYLDSERERSARAQTEGGDLKWLRGNVNQLD